MIFFSPAHLSLGCRNDLNNSYMKHLIKCGRNKCWVLLFIDLEFNFCIARTQSNQPFMSIFSIYLLSFRIWRGQSVARIHTHTKQIQKSALVSEECVCVYVCICKLTSALKCKSRLISTGAADVYVVNRTNDNEKRNHIVSFSLTISNESSCQFAC